MSSDQRPGKVRVFSSGQMAETPRRRRGDTRANDGAAAMAPGVKKGNTGWSLALAGLFLLGCAIGGALFASLGLMPGAGR
jgi:hypothetical protein